MNNFKSSLIFNLVLTIFVVAFLIGGIFFLKSKINFYVVNTNLSREKLNRMVKNVIIMSDLQKQYQQALPYMNILNGLFTSYYNLLEFEKELKAIAAKRGLEFSFSFSEDSVKGKGKINYLNFFTSVSSDNYDNLLYFLDQLQHFKYLNSIEDVSLSTRGEGIYLLNIRGKVFYKNS